MCMKKISLIFLFCSFVMIISCNNKEDNIDTGVHMNVITGKIIEIKNENLILLEITKERGGYKIGEKVLIKYKEFCLEHYNDSDEDTSIGEPNLQDEVGVQFWDEQVKQDEEYDLIEVSKVYKAVYD